MPRSLLEYLLTLGLCLTAYEGYRHALAPWIDPPPPKAAPLDQQPVDEEIDQRLYQWFPEGSWQRQTPKRLQTEAGLLLFREWQRGEGKDLRLFPVSIIVTRDDANAEHPSSPIIIDAPQGAVIQLSDTIDLAGGGAPPISGGHFLGPVHIYSLPSAGGSEAAIDVQTSNVRIDRHRIWTADPVVVNYDQLVLRGRDLMMQLYQKGAQPAGREGPMATIERLELIYLDQLRMHLPNGGLWQPDPHRTPPPALPDTADVAYVEASCQGPVSVNFASLSVTLQQRVELRHQLPGELTDTLRCERLELTLAESIMQAEPPASGEGAAPSIEPLAAANGPPTAPDPQTAREPKTVPIHRYLVGLEARGDPVVFVAPTLRAEGRTSRVQVDLRSGEARLQGATGVSLNYGTWSLIAPSLRYRFNPEMATALGALMVAGPGRFENSDPQSALRQLRWANPIHLVPDAPGHRLDLVGGIAGDLADGGHLRADEVHAWLVPTVPDIASSTSLADRPAAHPPVAAPHAMQMQLDRVWASGRVEVVEPRVDLLVDEVQLWFAPHRAPQHDGSVIEPVARQTLPGSLAQRSAGPGPGLQPGLLGGGSDPAAVAGSSPLAPPRRPTQIRGRKLAARLATDPLGMVVQDLSLTGQVQMEHPLQSAAASADAFGAMAANRQVVKLIGEGVRWINDPADGLLLVQGQPARLELDDGYLVGQTIHVQTSQNRLWIDQAGSCQLPTSAATASPASDTNQPPTASMRWVSPPLIVWQNGLTFDGQQLVVDGQVQFNGRMESLDRPGHWHLGGRADQLQLLLDQRMVFTDPQAVRPQLHQVVALGSVVAAGTQFGPTGQQQAYHLLQVGQLNYFPATGAIDSPGAGDYRLWTLSTNLRQIQTPSGLAGMHLAYNERLEGSAPQGWLQATGGVRVGYSPVDSWEHAIEVDRMEQLASGQMRLDCQRLRVQRPPNAPPTRSGPAWELSAAGDVRCAGASRSGPFQATAAEAHYSTQKELLTIVGDGRRPAVIESQASSNRPGGQLQAELIHINPETLEVDFQLRGARTDDLQRLSQ